MPVVVAHKGAARAAAHKVVHVRGVFREFVLGPRWMGAEEGRLRRPYFGREPRRKRQCAQRVLGGRAHLGRLGKYRAVPEAQLVDQQALRAILPRPILANGGNGRYHLAAAQRSRRYRRTQRLRLLAELVSAVGPRRARRAAILGRGALRGDGVEHVEQSSAVGRHKGTNRSRLGAIEKRERRDRKDQVRLGCGRTGESV